MSAFVYFFRDTLKIDHIYYPVMWLNEVSSYGSQTLVKCHMVAMTLTVTDRNTLVAMANCPEISLAKHE